MSETYTVGGDALYLLDHLHVAGQTFTPIHDHVVQYVDLNLESSFFTAPVRIDIHHTDAWHEPIGDPIASARADTPNPLIPSVSRVRAAIYAPVLLNAGSEYALLVYYKGLILGTRASWQYDQALAAYPRGHRIHSDDEGATWTHEWDQDHIFCEFGDPPLPKPLPPPPVDHFAIVNIQQHPIPNGIKITITTTVPCELIMLVTDKEPQKHPRTRDVRGITVPWYTYFCFVAYKGTKQKEAGDTLYHTFEIVPWPKATLLFTFFDITKGSGPPYWEPWGATLTENNPWEYNIPIGGIDYTLYDGLIRLDNPSMDGCGIKCHFDPLDYPLQHINDSPLCFTARSLEPPPLSHDAWIAAFIWTTNGTDRYLIEPVITRGDWWGPWPSLKWGHAATCGLDYGLDPWPMNLLDFWIWARTNASLPADPTGWYIDYIALLFEAVEYEPNPYLINNYVHLYYPPKQYKFVDKQTRWISLKGEVDFIISPSVGPIIKKHHLRETRVLTLRPNAPGDKCTIPNEVGADCPNHYLNVDEANPDEDATKIYAKMYPQSSILRDLYHIEAPPIPLPLINKVIVVARLRETANPHSLPAVSIGLKTYGNEYPKAPGWFSVKSYWDYYWEIYPLNPFTHLPWTEQEIIDLQIGVGLYDPHRPYPGWWDKYTHCTQMYLDVEYETLI